MLFINEADALKVWGWLEAETNELEESTLKLEGKLTERQQKQSAPDSFSLQWQAEANASRIAIRNLRADVETATSGALARNGQPLAVAYIRTALSHALRAESASTLNAADLVESRARTIYGEKLGAVLQYALLNASLESEGVA